MLVTLSFLTFVGCYGAPSSVEDVLADPDVAEANRGIVKNEEKTQSLLADLHNHVQKDVDRINAKLNRPGEPGVIASSLMQIDDVTDSDDSTDSSDVDTLKASFESMHKDRAEMQSLDKEAKDELHAFRRGEKEAKKMLSHVEMIRDLRHKKHVWRENRVAARVRAAQPSSLLEEENKKAKSPADDRMLANFMAKMTAQKEEYDEERKEAEEETRKARAEIARAQQKSFPSSLVQTLPDTERSDNLGEVEKTLGELKGRMREQLDHFAAAGRKDKLAEDLELKRMHRAFPGSFTELERPHVHNHHRHGIHHSGGGLHHRGHNHHYRGHNGVTHRRMTFSEGHAPHHHASLAEESHPRSLIHKRTPLEESIHQRAEALIHRVKHAHASALVEAGDQPVLDDSKLNADLAAFSDATSELGKEEKQMKSDAAKFSADMDAATVNAGSFLQEQDRSEEGDRKPSSLAEMGEITALGEWRKRMEERQREVKDRQEEQRKMSASFHPFSFLETGSKDIPDFGSDDLDSASSASDMPSFDHSSSDSLDTPDFTPPSDSTDTDALSPSTSFGDSSLDDPTSSSSDFGGSTSFDSGLGSSDISSPDISSPDLSTPDISTPDFSSPDINTPDFGSSDSSLSSPDFSSPDDSTSSFTPMEPSADFGSASSDDALGSTPSFDDSASTSAGDAPLFDTSSDSLDDGPPMSLVETKTKTKVGKQAKKTKAKAVVAKKHEADDGAHLRRK